MAGENKHAAALQKKDSDGEKHWRTQECEKQISTNLCMYELQTQITERRVEVPIGISIQISIDQSSNHA